MKKRIAMLLALVMIFAMATPVFADPGVVDGQIIGAGQVPATATIDPMLITATVPTTVDLGFTIDPFGLLELEEGQVFNDEPVTNGVTWVTGAYPVLYADNSSGFPVLFTADLAVTNADGTAAPTGVTPVATEGALSAATPTGGRNVLFWMEPGVGNTSVIERTYAEQAIAFGTHAAPARVGYRIEEVPHQMIVTSAGPPANIDWEPIADDPVPNGVFMRLNGIFNHTIGTGNVDWNPTGGTNIGIRTVFRAQQIHEGATIPEQPYFRLPGVETNMAYGLLAGGAGTTNLINATSGVFPALSVIPVPRIGPPEPTTAHVTFTAPTPAVGFPVVTMSMAEYSATGVIVRLPSTITSQAQITRVSSSRQGTNWANPWQAADLTFDPATHTLTITRTMASLNLPDVSIMAGGQLFQFGLVRTP